MRISDWSSDVCSSDLFATTAGFRIYACEGYDPESKGKVEAGVKYVKQDGLYGEEFASEKDLRHHLQHWLETVANARVHGATGRVPRGHFEQEERQPLRSYLSPTSKIGRASVREKWVQYVVNSGVVVSCNRQHNIIT